jgi:hypothetical protein
VGERVEVVGVDYEDEEELAKVLRGVDIVSLVPFYFYKAVCGEECKCKVSGLRCWSLS